MELFFLSQAEINTFEAWSSLKAFPFMTMTVLQSCF